MWDWLLRDRTATVGSARTKAGSTEASAPAGQEAAAGPAGVTISDTEATAASASDAAAPGEAVGEKESPFAEGETLPSDPAAGSTDGAGDAALSPAPEPVDDAAARSETLAQERAQRAAECWREAEKILAAAVQRWPQDEDLLIDYGLLANQQSDWPMMAERFAVVRERFPHHLFGYSRAAWALNEIGLFDEAEQVIMLGIERFPNASELLVQWVLTACGREAWEDSRERAKAFMDRAPDDPAAYRFAAHAYALQGLHDLADAAVAEGLYQLGPVPELVILFAQQATDRQDWRRAGRRWDAAALRFPEVPGVHEGRFGSLMRQGRRADAERVLGAEVERRPGDIGLGIEYARMADLRADVNTSQERWTRLAGLAPDHPGVRHGLENLRLLTGAPEAPDEAARRQDTDATAVLAAFESLGESCEFGLLQRKFNLEPISLLRWAATEHEQLMRALAANFESTGDPEHTFLITDAREYIVGDTRFGLNMHTFVAPHEVERDRFFASQCRRLDFLVRKFREDLATGERIFVRSTDVETNTEDVLALHTALRRYGPVVLLHVTVAQDPAQAGTVEWLDDDLMVGQIDHFGRFPGNRWDISVNCWLEICRRALDLRASARSNGQSSQEPAPGAG